MRMINCCIARWKELWMRTKPLKRQQLMQNVKLARMILCRRVERRGESTRIDALLNECTIKVTRL